jgi:GT2 family glycosyltransferase
VEIAVKNKNVILARNDEALGYTKAANMAISLSKSENLVLLNSDTVIGARALRKMLNCIDTQTGCGIVGPLSNAASSQSIPNHLSTVGQTAINALPKGYSVSQMDSWCEENSRDLTSPSVPFVHGFCMCVKREVFDKIGYFDEESFPYGYGEENDLCIRASEEGYRLNIAVDAFVFHSKSKSYSDERRRKSLMKAGNIKLRDLHGTERVDRLVQSMQQNPTLAKMRDRSLALY